MQFPSCMDTTNDIPLLAGGENGAREVSECPAPARRPTSQPANQPTIHPFGLLARPSVSRPFLCPSLLLTIKRNKSKKQSRNKINIKVRRVRGAPQQRTNINSRPISSSISPQRPLFCRGPHDISHKPGTISSSQPSKWTVTLVVLATVHPHPSTHMHMRMYCTPTHRY